MEYLDNTTVGLQEADYYFARKEKKQCSIDDQMQMQCDVKDQLWVVVIVVWVGIEIQVEKGEEVVWRVPVDAARRVLPKGAWAECVLRVHAGPRAQ